MPAQVSLILGPPRAGKTFELVRQYRTALCASPLTRALWIAPTARSAADVRQQLLAEQLVACLAPGVVTFDELTDQILSDSKSRLRTLTPAMQRELLRRVIQSSLAEQQLAYFADAAGRAPFVDLLAEHIRELKRRGIGPEQFSKSLRNHPNAPTLSELANLYSAYHQKLEAHDLSDTEGRHWAALDALAANAAPHLRDFELIVVDGFADFTHTQHDILRELSQRAKQLLISLPLESPTEQPPRDDLFAKVHATREELKHYHPQLAEQMLPSRPTKWSALDHITNNIFRNPGQMTPVTPAVESSLHPIEIVEAAGAQDEIVQLARRIKSSLATGQARPGEIAVVFRSLPASAPRIREVFTEYGIPFSLEAGERLASAAVLRTLHSCLRLHGEDWPFRQTIALVTNNTLSALDESRQPAERLIRELQVAKSRETLLKQLDHIANRPEENLSDSDLRRRADAATALAGLNKLAAALDGLPSKATPLEWITALANLGVQLGLTPFAQVESLPKDAPPTPDQIAWQLLTKHFAAIQRLNDWLGKSPQPWSLDNLLTALIDIAQHEPMPRPFDEIGRVRVLAAGTARTVSARHLYLAGMSEQSFPAAERVGRPCSDADYRLFASSTGRRPVASKAKNPDLFPSLVAPTLSQEEMLLFYEVLTRAEESLTISYPALDDKAQQLPPSPYVTEIRRTLSPVASIKTVRSQLSPTQLDPTQPGAIVPLSNTDLRIQSIARAINTPAEDRDLRLLAGVFSDPRTKPLASAIDAGLQIVHARADSSSFGPAEGIITSPAVQTQLANRFGPDHHWSPSQWEQYASCPYKFFLQYVLRLEPLGELVLDTDYLRRGSLMHDVMARSHREWHAPSDSQSPVSPRDEAAFPAYVERVLNELVEAMPRSGVEAALQELDRRQIGKWIDAFQTQRENYNKLWSEPNLSAKPAYLEFRFGPTRQGASNDDDPNSVESPLLLDIEGEQIRVTGRIDRIDVAGATPNLVFTIVDYKSGARPTMTSEKIETGERLQPALYVMAAQALLFGEGQATPLWAGYWSMQTGVSITKSYPLHCSDGGAISDAWNELQPKIKARVGQFVKDIRVGIFPVYSRDDHCTSRCNFNTVCRIAQVRSLGKVPSPQPSAS